MRVIIFLIMSKNIFTNNQYSSKIQVETIMSRIAIYERRRIITKFSIHSFILALAGTSLIYTTNYLILNMNDSGFMDYMSLIFTDSSTVLSYIGDFILSLASSWPIFATILVVGTLLIFINSIAKTLQYYSYLSINHKQSIS
jgi:hypothetical protein